MTNLSDREQLKELIKHLEFKVSVSKQTGLALKDARIFSDIIDILQSYLSAEMPEEKTIGAGATSLNSEIQRQNYVDGFNEALRLCRLSSLKDKARVEELEEALRSLLEWHIPKNEMARYTQEEAVNIAKQALGLTE
jgi:hypothetical protein